MSLTIPPELKPIVPFLQRAEETKKQNPVISYWCTYYAIQIALSLKFDKKDRARTLYLANMMDFLEQEKQRLASHEAIVHASVSSAFVENFALHIFTNADDEDRRGNLTRSTAKKFLAAANFLELLKIFDTLPPDIEEKIRYAKWKAADIAKAFREGRQPQPGPPGGDGSAPPAISPPSSAPSPCTHPHSPPESQPTSPRIPATNLSGPTQSSISNPNTHPFDSQFARSTPLNNSVTTGGMPINPDLWSNITTSGSVEAAEDSSPAKRSSLSDRQTKITQDEDAWSNTAEVGGLQNSYHNPFIKMDKISGESASLGSTTFVSPSEDPIQGGKHVRWTPSVTGGSSSICSPPDSPETYRPTLESLPERHLEVAGVQDLTPPDLGTFVVSQEPTTAVYSGHSDLYPSAPPVVPPVVTHQMLHAAALSAPPVPAASTPTVELTNAIISQVQKHCRFAISSLDYEDAEQAKKELRDALALLGG